jgi:hypothetical protein
MRYDRRRVLKATGVALGGVGLAGCNETSGENPSTSTATETATPTATPTETPEPPAEASAATALAAEWNVMRARLHDAMALGEAGETAAAASLVGDVFARFENAGGEWGAHEGLESTSESAYESFEEHLGAARTGFEEGSPEDAMAALGEAEANLLSAQRGRTSETVAEVFTILVYAARVRDVDALATAGMTDAAAAVGQRVLADFEQAAVHDTVESAGEEYYEAFEGGMEDAVSAADSGDGEAVHEAALASSQGAVDAAYELTSEAVAGVAHLSLFGAVGFDAEMAAGLGGPGLGVAHAAGLNGYRARVRDAAWLYDAGESEAAKAAAQSVLQHFEGARAHEALEEASADAYETFEHEGLEALVTAIEDGDDAGVDDAVATTHDGLTTGIEALAGERAAVLQSGFFRARLGDAHERYLRGEGEVAAAVAESLFARFEENEAGFHESLEDASEDLYHTFEEDHLVALPDAFRNGDDEAVETHVTGAMDALVEFEATAGSTPVAGAAAGTYMTGRACDAGVLATLGATDRADAVASDAFAYFEAGANGFHEAVEAASEERYAAFEEALGAVRSATTGDADAYDAATAFADEATAAVYAVVENGGSGGDVNAAPLVSAVFATFENARVHARRRRGRRPGRRAVRAGDPERRLRRRRRRGGRSRHLRGRVRFRRVRRRRVRPRRRPERGLRRPRRRRPRRRHDRRRVRPGGTHRRSRRQSGVDTRGRRTAQRHRLRRRYPRERHLLGLRRLRVRGGRPHRLGERPGRRRLRSVLRPHLRNGGRTRLRLHPARGGGHGGHSRRRGVTRPPP